MATVSVRGNKADVAEVTFDLSHVRSNPLDFLIEIVYPNSSRPTDCTEPEVSFNGGLTFVPVVDGAFTTAPNTRYIVFRFKLNNDNAIVEDNYVLTRLSPAPGNTYITNTAPIEVSVEIMENVTSSTITVDSPSGTVTENGSLVTDYMFTPPLSVQSTVQLVLVPGSATLAEIGTLEYSTDGILFYPVPVNGEVSVPQGTSGFSVKLLAGHSPSYDSKTFVLRTTFVMTGVSLTKEITITNTDNHPAGELISESCDGFNKMGLYHDGNGSTYIDMIEYRSPDCGFLFPPVGEVILSFCAGFDRYEHIADGLGGHTTNLVAHNSLDCGYIPPDPNTQTQLIPTVWNTATKGEHVILSDNDRTFAGLRRDGVRTVYGALFGYWYSEFTVYMPTPFHRPPSIGLVTTAHPMGDWIGSNPNGWAWWPHEGTKYHSDVQGFYGPEVHDGDVISLLYDNVNSTLSFWLNGVDLGVMYSNLPTTTKLYIAINALDESFAIANFGQSVFAYEPPPGYYTGFGVLFNPPIERGTIVGFTCQDTTKYDTKADGKFGTYSEFSIINSPDCGWIPPPPPAGTILSYFCVGLNQYKKVADGNYGSTDHLVQVNSTSCGYVPPPTPTFAPATLNPAYYANGTSFSNGNKRASLESSVKATNAVYSGKWYWELDTTSPNIVVGLNVAADTAASVVGHTGTSFGWSIAAQETFYKGVATPRPTWPIVTSTDRIGVYLNSVAQSLTFSVNGVEIGAIENIDIATFFPAFSRSDLSATPIINVYFDSPSILVTPPTGFVKGYGVANTVYQIKGVYSSQYCDGTTMYYRYSDGGGGLYSDVFQINSPACGWRPPRPAGEVQGYVCGGPTGMDLYISYADGNYGNYDVLETVNSEACGYKPAGALISLYCVGYVQMGRYSDGNMGTYDDVVNPTSPECGYGTGGPQTPLPSTQGSDLVFSLTDVSTGTDLVFKS